GRRPRLSALTVQASLPCRQYRPQGKYVQSAQVQAPATRRLSHELWGVSDPARRVAGATITDTCVASFLIDASRAALVFHPLRQFLVVFGNFEHHSPSFRIAEGLGQSRRLFGAFS